MNIFYVDSSPKLAAQSLVDSHVNKMVIESAQMLANAYSLSELREAPLTQSHEARQHSYVSHPCSKWVLSSLCHWNWLSIHALELVSEKIYRTGKGHFTFNFIRWVNLNPPNLLNLEWNDPPCAMPTEYIIKGDVIGSYRNYYTNGKQHLHRWTRRSQPWWMPIYRRETYERCQ